jgi:hypothetical protein
MFNLIFPFNAMLNENSDLKLAGILPHNFAFEQFYNRNSPVNLSPGSAAFHGGVPNNRIPRFFSFHRAVLNWLFAPDPLLLEAN